VTLKEFVDVLTPALMMYMLSELTVECSGQEEGKSEILTDEEENGRRRKARF
jgi:hypothetical protein